DAGSGFSLGSTDSYFPLSYEENRGQVDSRARFYARGGRYTISLLPDSVELRTSPARTYASAQASPPEVKGGNLILRFEGANPAASMSGVRPLDATLNSFRGSDPSRWVTRIPLYQEVVSKDVYPGVDVVYSRSPRPEMELVVAPGV